MYFDKLNRMLRVLGGKLFCLGVGGVTDTQNITVENQSLQDVIDSADSSDVNH